MIQIQIPFSSAIGYGRFIELCKIYSVSLVSIQDFSIVIQSEHAVNFYHLGISVANESNDIAILYTRREWLAKHKVRRRKK